MSFNDHVSVYNMWEGSVYDYNATRPNIFFTVKHSRYIPCMLVAQKTCKLSKDNIFFTVNRCISKRDFSIQI